MRHSGGVVRQAHHIWYTKNIAFIITNKIVILAAIIIGLTFPWLSPVAQTQPVQSVNQTQNSLNQLPAPNIQNITKSLTDINQLQIINEVTKPLNDLIGGFLKGGQGSVIPSIKSGLESIGQGPSNYLNNSNLPNTNVSIGELIDKSKEAFILIAQILVYLLEIALWVLRGILGWIT